MSSTLDIEVSVLDINDNPPEFEQTTYWASIPESAAIGQYVTRIHATSRDTGENARISYYIQNGNDKGIFVVDTETGKHPMKVFALVGLLVVPASFKHFRDFVINHLFPDNFRHTM